MERPFDREACEASLAKLSFRARLAFSLSCAERMRPSYDAFVAAAHWGQVAPLERALELGWRTLEGGRQLAHSAEVGLLQREIAAVTPDTEDFESTLVSPALNAAAGASELVALLYEDDPVASAEIPSLCVDTIDLFVQASDEILVNADDADERVLRHPLMQRELRRQRTDFKRVASCKWGQGAIAELKRVWASPTVSILGLSAPSR